MNSLTYLILCARMQGNKLDGRLSSSGKSPVVKQQTLPTMPQRHMWLHRLLFFLDMKNSDTEQHHHHHQQQQQQQGGGKMPILAGAGLQLPPTALTAGLVQPQVYQILEVKVGPIKVNIHKTFAKSTYGPAS